MDNNVTIKMVVGAISLGCAKNRIDTEELLGIVNKRGYKISSELEEADIIIVNTCAFISDARSESLGTIREVSQYKKSGKCRLLVVTGCLPQKYQHQLLKEMPEIDLMVGVHSYDRLGQLLELAINKKVRMASFKEPPLKYSSLGERILTLPGHSVFLKIAEGCNNRCHYCIIPGIRGPYRSRPIQSIMDEAEMLVGKGTREINLVAQDTTYYGREKTGGKTLLPKLLKKLSRIEQLDWIRLMYAHPSHIDEETIEIMASENKICSYIDLPLQHINSSILKNMGRNYTREHVIKLIQKLKNNKMTIRSTFMVGFPGETDHIFQELLSFIEEYPLERVGAFLYSAEKNTPSYYLKGHLPLHEKQKRYEQFMSLQKRTSGLLNRNLIGRILPIMVEGKALKTGRASYYRGRTAYQAPEVDGAVIFASDNCLFPGQMVNVKIYGCGSYDLLGIDVSGDAPGS